MSCSEDLTLDKCVNCNKEISTPVFKFGGRQNGKSTMLLYYNIRQACCSDECCREFIKKMQEQLPEGCVCGGLLYAK